MSIPYNDNLKLSVYQSNPEWHLHLEESAVKNEGQGQRAADELLENATKQPFFRTIQFIRDTARLILKVPVRAVWTPIILEKNWAERERATVNAKLTGYAIVQLASVPPKFLVALVAIVTSVGSQEKAKWLLDTSEAWTKHLDGRTSQL